MPNARMSDRALLLAEVDVLAAGAPCPRRVWGSDVSETGIFLQTTHPFRAGDRVSLRFDLDTHEVHVRVAEVVWVRPFEPPAMNGRMPGAGLRFLAVEAADRATLRRFVLPRVEGDPHMPPVDGNLETSVAPSLPVTSLPVASPPLAVDTVPPRWITRHARDALEPDATGVVTSPPGSAPSADAGEDPPDDGALRLDVRLDAPADRHGAGSQSPDAADDSVSDPALTGLDLRFNDTGPGEACPDDHDTLPPSLDSTLENNPFDALLRQETHADAADFPSDAHRQIENGHIALHQMPAAGSRRRLGELGPTARWALPVAVGLLCTGVGIGLAGQRDLPASSAGPRHAQVPPALATDSRRGDPPAGGSGVDSTARMVAASTLAAPSAPAGSPPAPRAAPSHATEATAVDISVGGAGNVRVLKTFTLSGPTRVVVDLENAAPPKSLPDARGPIQKIRFGSPAPGTLRVVLELNGQKMPRDATARIKDGILRIAFQGP